ncbi:MAG: hypothetical protein HWN81_13280, partial [Candidatus Lokiarchaeota archaeon]|nr:hypothetical protein [Candidatus Lokiarchaeota archaeon]
YLTQQTLKNNTGLSSGKISQEVNKLLEDGLIEKAEVTDKGKITYSASSAGLILIRFSRSIINRFTKWEKNLVDMKLEFENNRRTLGKLKGYNQIYKLLIFLMETLSLYKKSLSIIDEVLNDL